jgi:hypothetical protein
MFVRFSTSFRGRLPFRTRDIFCQFTSYRYLFIRCLESGAITFSLKFSAGLVSVCVYLTLFQNVCH